MKSIIRQRREQGAICLVCKSPDYTIYKNDSFEGAKPNIRCGGCGNIWQNGYDAGIYEKLTLQKIKNLILKN